MQVFAAMPDNLITYYKFNVVMFFFKYLNNEKIVQLCKSLSNTHIYIFIITLNRFHCCFILFTLLNICHFDFKTILKYHQNNSLNEYYTNIFIINNVQKVRFIIK